MRAATLAASPLVLVVACASRRETAAEPERPPPTRAQKLAKGLVRFDLRHLRFECAPIATPGDVAADGFRYEVVLDRRADLFWVHVTGGLAGTSEFRGPQPAARYLSN